MELMNRYTDVWEAPDGSGLRFNSREKPKTVKVVVLETSNVASPPEYEIDLAGLQHLRSVTCHQRPCGWNKATWGSNTIHAVYHLDRGPFEARVVISEMSGLGPRFFCHGGQERKELMDTLCQSLTEHQMWDFLHLLVRTYDHAAEEARRAEFRRFAQAYVDGRLAKQKVRGTGEYKVEIKPVVAQPERDGCATMQIGIGPVPGVPALVR